MSKKRIISTVMSAALALSQTAAAFAAGQPLPGDGTPPPASVAAAPGGSTEGLTVMQSDEKTERIVTAQNGTGYTVSSVGRHVIGVEDSSKTFVFAPQEGYDLTRLVLTDETYTDYADVGKMDRELSLNGAAYPIRYESKIDAQGTSVIRATVSIPAAQDDITLSAEAVSSEYTVTATSQSGATVSSGLTKLGKGEAYTMTARPDGNLYCITRADLTIGQNKTIVALSKGCDVQSQGYRFTMDAEGMLTVYCGGVTSPAAIELKTAEREPDSDEVLVTVHAGRGISSEVSKDIVKKGSNYTVSFSANRGYAIDALTLEADGKTAYSTPNTNTVFVGTNAYRVSGSGSACTVYLTDLQSNITVSAESVYDSDNLLVTTSAGTGVKIDKNCGSSVEVGTDVDFDIYVTDEDKYELDRITLQIGDSSQTVDADETSIRVSGETYRMTTDEDGVTHLYVTDIDKPVRVSATASRINTSHSVTIQKSNNLTISKNTGSTVSHGKDVKFTIKPDSGYTVDTVTLKIGSKSETAYAGASIIAVDGIAYDMERSNNGTVTVYVDNVRADVTISAEAEKVSSGSGSNGKISIDRSVRSPFFIGYGTQFHPEDNMTRAEAVQLLVRMTDADADADYPPAGFSDVQTDDYYTDALDAFVYGGVVDVDTSYFRPYASVTRAEFVEMMYRLDTTGGYKGTARFYDVYAGTPEADAIAYCAGRGWVNGYPDGTFRPDAPITRAEAAAVVNRVMGRTLASSDLSGVYYTDVPQGHWAYADIMTASSYQR
ncbi:S-layer homology domain-containing protein [Candidatus Agathobaculum pullicola]|uniref:S-layer homology domain-containing protein n=1 Tax=Candidatus Agathobaculum pullicola TaxID=2838426 RepID=UPI003F9342E5